VWRARPDRAWTWSALLVEGASIQLIAGIPAALLLAIAFRNWAVPVACALSAVFACHSVSDWNKVLNTFHVHLFLVWIALCHVLFLMAFTAVFVRRRRPPRPGAIVRGVG
jgi:hypothetical protein